MTRVWKDVVRDPRYEVSNDGLIRRKAYLLKPHPLKRSGHLHVSLSSRARVYVHRLVAAAFIGDPPDATRIFVNHKNGNPSDNRVENLEWVTPGENISHGYKVNGRKHHASVPVRGVTRDGEIVAEFESAAAAAAHYGVTKGAVCSAISRQGTCKGLYWLRVRG